MTMDIIETYYDTIREITDSPEVFIRASAYHLLSSTVGRFFRCRRMNQSQKAGFRPNTWFLISSIPGGTRRSTITWYVQYTYEEIMNSYFDKVLPSEIEVKVEDGSKALNKYERRIYIRKMVKDSVIEEGTPEGVTDHINYSKLGEYSIVSPEFGPVLTKMFSKDHQEGMASLLSKLYYGEGGSMALSQRGKDKKGRRYVPDGLYVTMFTGMQEPWNYLNSGMLRQGLLRRIMLIYCKIKDMDEKDYKVPIKDEDIPIHNNLSKIVGELNRRMLTYNRMYPEIDGSDDRDYIDVDMTPSATRIINEFDRVNFNNLRVYETDLSIFKQGFWEHLSKISILNAVSRENFKFLGTDSRGVTLKTLAVEKVDVEKALSFLKTATKYSEDVVSSLSNIDVPIYNARAPLEKIFNIIKGAGERGIPKNILINKSGMTTDELKKYTSTLFEAKRIKIWSEHTRGRPRTMYSIGKSQ